MSAKILKRLLCLVLCLAVLAPCAAALGETTKVTGYLVRLREKASKDGKVLDAYPRGTKVTILKKGDTWTKVSVHDKEGYMMTCYLAYSKKEDTKKTGSKSTDSKSESKKKSGSSSGTEMYVMEGTKLNLRAEASSDGEIIGSYRAGTKVTVLKKGKIWCQVEVKGKTGYMATEYLTSEK